MDSTDRERLEQAKVELHQALSEDELWDVSLLVMANKQDLSSAVSPDEVQKGLELDSLKQRNWGKLYLQFYLTSIRDQTVFDSYNKTYSQHQKIDRTTTLHELFLPERINLIGSQTKLIQLKMFTVIMIDN